MKNKTTIIIIFSAYGRNCNRSFDEKKRHYGTDIVAKANAKVAAVLDGVVIFTDWTVKTGYVIQVQHTNDLISVYKHNSILLKNREIMSGPEGPGGSGKYRRRSPAAPICILNCGGQVNPAQPGEFY